MIHIGPKPLTKTTNDLYLIILKLHFASLAMQAWNDPCQYPFLQTPHQSHHQNFIIHLKN